MDEPMTTDAVGCAQRFITAFSSRDRVALTAVLAPAVRFRGMTPGQMWETGDRDGALAILLGSWLEPTDHVEAIVSQDAHEVVDRVAFRYRWRVRSNGVLHTCEQSGVATVEDGAITDIAIVCSGFRPFVDG
jgi:ketosteroid isomerase-like protein